MTLRRAAVPQRRSPSWRRSGDDSHWESLLPGGEGPRRTARPQSFTADRDQADRWFRELERTQSGPLRHPQQDHRGDRGLPFNRLAATPTLRNQDPPGGPDRTGTPGPAVEGFPWSRAPSGAWSRAESQASSRAQSVCNSSSLGSQESLLDLGVRGPPSERRGSWERARILEAPAKEQARVSALAPVRVGWLPVQRRVRGLGAVQSQHADHSAGSQMKMKQPITPIIQRAPTNGFRHQDGEEEQSESRSYRPQVGTGRSSTATDAAATTTPASPLQQVAKTRGPLTWQSLTRGWGLHKTPALSGGPEDAQAPTSAAPPEGWRPRAPLRRTDSVQPATPFPPPTGPATVTSSTTTTSTTTTLIPHQKVSFSSITISSKKVTRTTSLPPGCYDNDDDDGNVRKVPISGDAGRPPPRPPPAAVTMRRKATIVKVTEQRVTSATATHAPRSSPDGPVAHGNAVVHRRKATVVKVTEQRGSYRHSYTEGLYREDRGVWPQGGAPDPPDPPGRTDDQALHRSTLSLVLSGGPAQTAPARARRPVSCYGDVFGCVHEEAKPRLTRRLSGGAGDPPSRPGRGGGGGEGGAGGDGVGGGTVVPLATRRPSLTLLKPPEAGSPQTAQDILALNAAAIIANIKLQRTLSRTKSQDGRPAKDPSSPRQGNEEEVGGKVEKRNPGQKVVQQVSALTSPPGPPPSEPQLSLQEALERSRPAFIARSQERVRALQGRKQERCRELGGPAPGPARIRRPPVTSSPSGRDGDPSSRNCPPAGPSEAGDPRTRTRTRTRREVCLANRRRVEFFQKSLLDQLLQRNNL